MTASKGVGRGVGGGGKKPGAGRKAKAMVAVAKNPEVSEAAKRFVEDLKTNETPASRLLDLAYLTLSDVMDNSPFPAPRVTAARAVIALAIAEQARALGTVETGKKAQAAAAAHKIVTAPSPKWGDALIAPAEVAN